LRGGPYLVVLTLQGLDTMPVAVVPIWDAFLESVDLPEWEAEDVPLFAPETDPGLKVFLGE